MNGQLPAPFPVSAERLQQVRAFIQQAITLSSHTALTVPAADFPTWLAALDREAFYAHTTKTGHRFVRAGYAVLGDPGDPNAPMLSVNCVTPPAPWVSFPETEGDRRYIFHYTTNPLVSNETEST